MATPSQDAKLSVTDTGFNGALYNLAATDVFDLQRRYGARFTLNSADPRPWGTTLSLFQGLPAGTVIPVVSGSKGGNAALASLLSALQKLGLVTDATTA